MEKGLLFFTLSMLALWAILDEFFGGQKISSIAYKLTPGADSKPLPWDDKQQAQKQKEANNKKIQADPNKSQEQKDFEKKANEKFYGPGPA